MARTSTLKSLAACLVLLVPAGGLAQDIDEPETVDAIAVELMNPIGRLSSVDHRLLLKSYGGDLPGAGGESNTSLVVEPVIPFDLSNGKRLALRFSIPVSLSTPTFTQGGKEHADWLIRQRADTLDDSGHFLEGSLKGHGHLDDIYYDVAYGDTRDDGRFWMFGLAGALPTSQDGSIERDQYLLGPQAAYGRIYDWGVFGLWARHYIDVANQSRGQSQHPVDWKTNETRLRLIFAYGLGDGWQIVSNPEITYDFEGASGNRVLLPLGAGVAKTFRVGSVSMKAGMEAYYYAASPDAFGPEWEVRFNLSPVLAFWSLD